MSVPSAALPSGPWLNVGSGPANPEPWVNLDGSSQVFLSRCGAAATVLTRLLRRPVGGWPTGIRFYDARKRLRFADSSVAVVFASHVLEHLYRDEALRFLRDAHRVLQRDGILRVVVPDVRAIVGWYLEHSSTPRSDSPSSDLLMDMLMVRSRHAASRRCFWRPGSDLHAHKWMYDGDGLTALVREAGFGSAAVCGYLQSEIPADALSRVEVASRVCDGAGVCVEARK